MKLDLEIAQENKMEPIETIAKLGINSEQLEHYGRYKAKIIIDDDFILSHPVKGKLVLVTAIAQPRQEKANRQRRLALETLLIVLVIKLPFVFVSRLWDR